MAREMIMESDIRYTDSCFNEARALWPGRYGRQDGQGENRLEGFNEARALWPGRYCKYNVYARL